jgi:hypothetical protein
MRTIDIGAASGSLADYAGHMSDETLVVVRKGKPLVALVPLVNTDAETVTLADDPRFLALIERSRSRRRREGTVSLEEMRRSVRE